MKWYLIWFLTITLPSGETLDTKPERMLMHSELDCVLAMEFKQIEQEARLGAVAWASHRTIAPYGGRGSVTSVTVGCISE